MRHLIFPLIACCAASPVFGVVVFSDDFNRADLGSAYGVGVSAGTDGGALIAGASFAELTNDLGATVNANGRVSASVSFSNFSAPFSGTLSANESTVTWESNFRYNRTTAPAGFSGGTYGLAFVLAASDADFTAGNGYAVVYGNTGSPDPIRLVRYSGGLAADSNLTNLVSSGVADLAAVNDYVSVRVAYSASTGVWQLFVRDDGAAGWADPATMNAANLVGASSDSTYTGAALTHAGFFWNYSTAAAQTAQFDNLKVTAVPEPELLLPVSLAGILGLLFKSGRGGSGSWRGRTPKVAPGAS